MHLNVILQWLISCINQFMKKDANRFNKRIKGYHPRYYYSSMGNNSMFVHPVEIHDRKTLTKFIHESVIEISTLKPAKKAENSEWKF